MQKNRYVWFVKLYSLIWPTVYFSHIGFRKVSDTKITLPNRIITDTDTSLKIAQQTCTNTIKNYTMQRQ